MESGPEMVHAVRQLANRAIHQSCPLSRWVLEAGDEVVVLGRDLSLRKPFGLMRRIF